MRTQSIGGNLSSDRFQPLVTDARKGEIMAAKVLLTLVVAVVVGASAVSVATGAAPTKSTRHYESDFVSPGGAEFCAFDVRFQTADDQWWINFDDGTFFVEAKSTALLTNRVSGRQVYLQEAYTTHFDPLANSGHTVGVLLMIRDVGGKIVATEAGNISIVDGAITKQTPNSLGVATPAPICAALAT